MSGNFEKSMTVPFLQIGSHPAQYPIIQGAMAVRVSRSDISSFSFYHS